MGVPEDRPEVTAVDGPQKGKEGEAPIKVASSVVQRLFFRQSMRPVHRRPRAPSGVSFAHGCARSGGRSVADQSLLLVNRLHLTLPDRRTSLFSQVVFVLGSSCPNALINRTGHNRLGHQAYLSNGPVLIQKNMSSNFNRFIC